MLYEKKMLPHKENNCFSFLKFLQKITCYNKNLNLCSFYAVRVKFPPFRSRRPLC